MVKALLALVALFFVANLVIWSALFDGGTPRSLVALVLGGRSGAATGTGTATPAASPPASPPSPTANPYPYADLPRPTPRPTALGGPALAAPPAPPRPAAIGVAPPTTGQAFTTVIRESDLNGQINAYLARQGDPPLKDVRLRFEPGRAILTGRVQVAGMSVEVRASGPVLVRAGRPAFLVESLDIGSLSAPEVARGAVVDAVNETVRRLTSDLNVDVTEITLATGAMTVVGRTR